MSFSLEVLKIKLGCELKETKEWGKILLSADLNPEARADLSSRSFIRGYILNVKLLLGGRE